MEISGEGGTRGPRIQPPPVHSIPFLIPFSRVLRGATVAGTQSTDPTANWARRSVIMNRAPRWVNRMNQGVFCEWFVIRALQSFKQALFQMYGTCGGSVFRFRSVEICTAKHVVRMPLKAEPITSTEKILDLFGSVAATYFSRAATNAFGSFGRRERSLCSSRSIEVETNDSQALSTAICSMTRKNPNLIIHVELFKVTKRSHDPRGTSHRLFLRGWRQGLRITATPFNPWARQRFVKRATKADVRSDR